MRPMFLLPAKQLIILPPPGRSKNVDYLWVPEERIGSRWLGVVCYPYMGYIRVGKPDPGSASVGAGV